MSTNDAEISVDGVGLAQAGIPVQDTSFWWNVKLFVKRTHNMIETLTNEGGNVASWVDDGSRFVIKSKSLLESQFSRFGFPKMKKYKSFEKQLNDYRFRKVPSTSVGQEKSFDSNAVFFYHPQFHRNNPAQMVSIVDRRSLKASTKSEDATVVGEDNEKLRNIFARLECFLEEIESMLNKRLERSASLQRESNTLSNFKSTRNASYEGVCPNAPPPRLYYDCPNPGKITENDFEYLSGLLLEDSGQTFPEQIDIASANISRSLSPFAMSTDNPDAQEQIEPFPYPLLKH